MKNKFFTAFYFALFLSSQSLAENLNIEAKNITLDKGKNISIFKDEVTIVTAEQNKIEADYVEYDRNEGFLTLKNNILAQDNQNNIVKTNYAEYDEKNKIFKSKGNTEIITTDKYVIKTSNVVLDSMNKIILSNNTTEIEDVDGNKVFLEGFEYSPQNNIFRSVGKIEIKDNKQNTYDFSQIYIDTKKKEILGTDIKAFLNQKEFKLNEKNKPRIFANTINLDRNKKQFDKSVFTLCDYRENDKCPPWTIQATKMLHDNKKKTIYYNNAVIKVYDVPIFYFPKLSHPDPSVERRSGFLLPMLSDTKNLGLGFTVPYFFAINEEKNFTLTSRIFQSENPLFLGEYHQAFKDSYLFTDFGYTEGYKRTSTSKKAGEKSHFFGRFVKNFTGKNNSQNTLSLDYQDVSNDKYLKLYRIDSSLVDYNTSTLESSLSFTHENDDLFLGVNTSIFETLKESYNDKYEYFLPEITLDKNLVSNRYGNLNLQSNLKVHNYDTNKTSNFLTNDFNWVSKNLLSENGVTGQILGNLKNINYSTKNIDLYKDDSTNELFGALGYLAEIDLEKNSNKKKHLLTPKMLVRYSPGSMRKESDGGKLGTQNAFYLNRLDDKITNYETGLTATLGFDYKLKGDLSTFDFSLAQIINEKENKKMSSESSLDEKLSDLVGESQFKLNDKISLNYSFAIDQNYSDLNYNLIGSTMNFDNLNINFDYLQEKKHYGDKEYFNTKVDYNLNENTNLSFKTKRNLITNSSEFYNLSYEYINDCLRAGIVYRREFYTDSELESENSLMFQLTLTPFGEIQSPTFNK